MIEIIRHPRGGAEIAGWVDGETQVRLIWRGTDGEPTADSTWTTYERVVSGERAALNKLTAIDGPASYVNLELISAELEPLTEVLACPACDSRLERTHGGLWCNREGRIVPGDELDNARSLKRFTESAMDVIDQAVSTGRLPG